MKDLPKTENRYIFHLLAYADHTVIQSIIVTPSFHPSMIGSHKRRASHRGKVDSFITAVELKVIDVDPLADVRIEHKKLQGVLAAFGGKVDNMIEMQRKDFIEAYDTHMQDIQRKLLSMRNRVMSIDKTFREDKLKGLQAEEEKYRNEALRLDKSVLSLTTQLNTHTANMKIYQSEVDWLLNKLAKEKNRTKKALEQKYNRTIHGSSTSIESRTHKTSEASFTYRIQSLDKCTHNNNNHQTGLRVEPTGYHLQPNEWPNPRCLLGQQINRKQTQKSVILSQSLPYLHHHHDHHPTNHHHHHHPISSPKHRQAKDALLKLVTERSIQSEVVTFLAQCENHYRKERQLDMGIEKNYKKELLQKLLDLSTIASRVSSDDGGNEKLTRPQLLKEIVRFPELYELLTNIIVESRLKYDGFSNVCSGSTLSLTGEEYGFIGRNILSKGNEEEFTDEENVMLAVDRDIAKYLSTTKSRGGDI